ncbi:hypothetical protein AXG93_1712s1780 [Marchantia polymorpha subsp. ruderalis]|uniref:Uncharacterized protein n=1 Tax=Marchantia polymorpha subsp. ruderalis TaxID=1480154 RepID=A0A176VYX5_MARPO|nr:hypothetical protein AXG93_1712s1780 [Marchantia polymorpha subsp. ruderalis]
MDLLLAHPAIDREKIVPGVYMVDNQNGDGRMSELPVRFISRARSLRSSPTRLASVAGFSGVLVWPNDLLEDNMSADDTPVHEDMEKIVSLVVVLVCCRH